MRCAFVLFSDEEPISLFQDLARDHSACREATVFKVASKKRCKTVCFELSADYIIQIIV